MKLGIIGKLFPLMFSKVVYSYTVKAVPELDVRAFQKKHRKEYEAMVKRTPSVGSMKDNMFAAVMYMACYSEVRALTDKSIDLQAGTIRVSGSVVPGPDHKFTEKDTNKNKSSTRTVPILIPRLKTILSCLDCPLSEKVQIHSLVTQRHAEAACRRAGITIVGNHDLRRSFVSLCFFLNIPEEQVMAWGGWSDYYTMHKTYRKIAEKTKDESAEKVLRFYQSET